ncbi:hypothetical protein [Brevibacillus daliensis]|uniref:hypothetical protein n=1 Tax=Brevibacillus daliensis TaxID=2892995 RepID=UPI001E2BB3BD|nr:hypothetical protein [Brevibacillus daliensis]
MRTILMIILHILILVVATSYNESVVEAALQHPSKKQVIIVAVDQFSFSDFKEIIKMQPLAGHMGEAGIAGATFRTAGPRTAANAYLLMGSGGWVTYTDASETIYGRNEKMKNGEYAGERIKQLGFPTYMSSTDEDDTLLFPGIYRLVYQNVNQPFTARIGLLGDSIRKGGGSTAFYGNVDIGDKKQRHAGFLAIDSNGVIEEGAVEPKQVLMRADTYPQGIRTNSDWMIKQVRKNQDASMLVIQFGDLARLYKQMPETSPAHFEWMKKQILSDLAKMIGQLVANRNTDQLVMVLSPEASTPSVKEKKPLTPFLMWEGANKKGGILSSLTTRQEGIISGFDLLPTVLRWLQLPLPEHVIGHVITRSYSKPANLVPDWERITFDMPTTLYLGHEGEARINLFLHEIGRVHRIYANRPAVMTSYVIYLIAGLMIGIALWYVARLRPGTKKTVIYRLGRIFLMSSLWFPVLFLVEPLFHLPLPSILLFGLVATLAWMIAAWSSRFTVITNFLLVSGVTVAGLLVDGFLGAKAMQRSFLGYDPVIGARFYGMGNEYEGVLIGASVLLVAALFEWKKRYGESVQGRQGLLSYHGGELLFTLCTLLGVCGILYYLVSPRFGANAGGFLAICFAYLVTYLRYRQVQFHKKSFLVLGGSMVVGILVLFAFNLTGHLPTTHVGQVANDIISGNWLEVEHILTRKLAMNQKLIRFSMWSKIFFLSLIVLAILAFYPEQYMRRLYESYPALMRGLSGVMAGSLAGLFLNDSGIVTAATSILFLVVPVLYATLSSTEKSEGR